jgi:hypothetical protein
MEHFTHRVPVVVGKDGSIRLTQEQLDWFKCDCAERLAVIQKCPACKRGRPKVCPAHRRDGRVEVVVAADGEVRLLTGRGDSGTGWTDD